MVCGVQHYFFHKYDFQRQIDDIKDRIGSTEKLACYNYDKAKENNETTVFCDDAKVITISGIDNVGWVNPFVTLKENGYEFPKNSKKIKRKTKRGKK